MAADETPSSSATTLATTPRIGRPPKWTEGQLEVLRNVLLTRVSGGELVQEVCRELGVSTAELHRWRNESPTFREAYARSREDQAHALAEEALRIVRNATADSAIVDRLRLDAAKWYTSKIAPRVFGERIAVEQDTTVRVIVEREAPSTDALRRIASASSVSQSEAIATEVHATQAVAPCDSARATNTATNGGEEWPDVEHASDAGNDAPVSETSSAHDVGP